MTVKTWHIGWKSVYESIRHKILENLDDNFTSQTTISGIDGGIECYICKPTCMFYRFKYLTWRVTAPYYCNSWYFHGICQYYPKTSICKQGKSLIEKSLTQNDMTGLSITQISYADISDVLENADKLEYTCIVTQTNVNYHSHIPQKLWGGS